MTSEPVLFTLLFALLHALSSHKGVVVHALRSYEVHQGNVATSRFVQSLDGGLTLEDLLLEDTKLVFRDEDKLAELRQLFADGRLSSITKHTFIVYEKEFKLQFEGQEEAETLAGGQKPEEEWAKISLYKKYKDGKMKELAKASRSSLSSPPHALLEFKCEGIESGVLEVGMLDIYYMMRSKVAKRGESPPVEIIPSEASTNNRYLAQSIQLPAKQILELRVIEGERGGELVLMWLPTPRSPVFLTNPSCIRGAHWLLPTRGDDNGRDILVFAPPDDAALRLTDPTEDENNEKFGSAKDDGKKVEKKNFKGGNGRKEGKGKGKSSANGVSGGDQPAASTAGAAEGDDERKRGGRRSRRDGDDGKKRQKETGTGGKEDERKGPSGKHRRDGEKAKDSRDGERGKAREQKAGSSSHKVQQQQQQPQSSSSKNRKGAGEDSGGRVVRKAGGDEGECQIM